MLREIRLARVGANVWIQPMAYELWKLSPPWRRKAALLLERIREAEVGSLPEDLPMPMEVEVIELLPQLIDPARDDGEEAFQLMDQILLGITKHGIWLHPEGGFAVTLRSD